MSKVSFLSSSRNFHLVLYPDSTTYDILHVLSVNVVNLKSCSKWAYCYHDKDINDDGSLKKKHLHLVLSCKYPVRYCDIINQLGVQESSMTLPDINSKVRTFRSMVRYLIHADNSKKFQYSFEDIVSNFDFSSFFDSSSGDASTSAFLSLLEFMSDNHNRRSVALFASSSGILGYYRQYYRILWDIIDYETYSNKKNFVEILDESIDNL